MAEMLLIFKTQYVCRAEMEWSGVKLSDDHEMMLWREILCRQTFDNLRGSLPKSDPLDFATKNTFALFFVGEEALVGVY